MTIEETAIGGVSGREEKHRRSVIDLFSGCGGMSLGFKQAGFEVLLAIDNDPIANRHYEMNLGQTPMELDLFSVSSEDVMTYAGVSEGELDVLTGCPPCQGFTQLRNKTKKYETNQLVERMARFVADIRPKFVVFENVPGILLRGNEEFTEYLRILKDAGYATVYDKLQAADYGVPQLRKRLIAISTRLEGLKEGLGLPRPTHCDPRKADGQKLKPWRTVRDAIGSLPPIASGDEHPTIPNHTSTKHSERVLEIIRNIPHDGGSRRDLPKHLWLKCHRELDRGAENIYGRMSWDAPSLTMSSRCTVPACGRFIHPEQDRGISIREALLLQTFPMYYRIDAGVLASSTMVGNAMPVRFAKRIALHVLKYLRTS